MIVAIVGFGYWGNIIKKYIEKKFELKYICSENYAEGVPFDTIINDSSIDAVFVSTPAFTHYSIVKQLLINGKHVFCEKPLCLNYAESKELLNLAKEKRLILFIDYIYCFSNSISYIFDNYCSKFKLKSVAFDIRQFGKFYNDSNCFENLAVHFIALLGLLKYRYNTFNNYSLKVFNGHLYNNLSSYGSIIMECNSSFKAIINVSLISSSKSRSIYFDFGDFIVVFDPIDILTIKVFQFDGNDMICIDKYSFDEKNNLVNVLNEFEKSVIDKDNFENMFVSDFTCKMLEELK